MIMELIEELKKMIEENKDEFIIYKKQVTSDKEELEHFKDLENRGI